MTLFDESRPASGSNVAEYSVSEISGALKKTVEDTFGHVRVRGEISGYRGPHASGHAYFSLKDDRARLEAVVWRTSFAKLAFKPEEGLEVVATGRLTTFPGSSKYQIVIDELQPAGAGALMALLNERRLKLEAEGLFAAERKRPLPYMPRVIGVITSPTGAVIRDICHRISDRFPVHLLVWPVRVQGEGSGAEVAAAIEGFNALADGGPAPRPDLLIVARGGGSLEDLWGFNDEAVVRAAAASTIPLISAVGHETDWTLIDHAADRRAPTPTGAAEIAVPVRAEVAASLASLHARNGAAISRQLDRDRRAVAASARGLPSPDMLLALPRRRLDEAASGIGRALRVTVSVKRGGYGEVAARLSPVNVEGVVRHKRAELRQAETHAIHAMGSLLSLKRQRLERSAAQIRPQAIAAQSAQGRHRLDHLTHRLEQALRGALDRKRGEFAGAARMAASLDPRQVLQRGYAIIRGPEDQPITRADDLTEGMAFEVEFANDQRRSAVATDAGTPLAAVRPLRRRTPKPRPAEPVDQGTLF
ncbi:exodeoxyribonuclease VII large subunit [Aurantimonas sp. MSK8Z-1]|uniref:exodeoxyribonuclease VII large subunit n=1 Tax=Mangrovibrevibacter kandeliae TaxID=2968473 RepID=UPI0021190444|nr:exodeoxyribonuclease VII large subunit [Aurantimonas sp. MSK8Z-1]MCW4113567.1 exodeoxyribonuclease VII large subunit [Aurantimonas sp. MSK8Z-1]